MRRDRLALAGAVALAGALAGAACSLLDDPPPDHTCKTNADCFRAQGEVCNVAKKMCEPQMDAGTELVGIDAP